MATDLVVVGPDDKDDGALVLPGNLPRSARPYFPEKDVDDDAPHGSDDIVDPVAAEDAPCVEEHGAVADDEPRCGAEWGRDEEAQSADERGHEEEEAFQEGVQVLVRLDEGRLRECGRRRSR